MLIKSNDILHVFTSTNKKIFCDQSQFILVVFLVFSLVYSCCLCFLRNPVVFDFITCISFYHGITKRSRAISCHSLFTTWECKQTWLLLNFVPTIDFTSSQFPAYEKRHLPRIWLCFLQIYLYSRFDLPPYTTGN